MGEIKGMGRRDFLKTAALSGLALGGAAALTGCAPSTGAEKGASAKASAGADVAWDKEVDVLVIGSGTGAFAALVAAAKGAESVCLVEKGTMWGGTAATSGGGLAVPLTYAATDAGITDSKEEVVKYFTNATDGRVDQAVLNSFIDNGSTFIDWISEEMGWKFAASPLFGDYYEPWMAGFPWVAAASAPPTPAVRSRLLRCGIRCPYDLFNQAFAYYDTGEPGHVNIPAYFICDAACWATYSLPGHTVGAVGDGEDSYFNETYGGEASDPSEVPAHFVKADTLEELAEKLGIDAAGLAAEIATFNENAAKGVDPVYHRGEKHLDINTTGVMAGSRTDLANPVLAPLATGRSTAPCMCPAPAAPPAVSPLTRTLRS